MNSSIVQEALARLRRWGGDGLVEDVVAVFSRESPQRAREVLAACRRGDGPAMAKAAHALRSSCGQLGAEALVESCALIERLGESGAVADAVGPAEQLLADVERFLRDLSPDAGPVTGPRPMGERRRTVGVVEDNADTRLILARILESRYEVDACATGTEALEAFRLRPPDAVLLDISLPGMDGLDVLSRLRDNPRTARVPVIALTAHAMVGDREGFLAKGFNGYVSKPILDENDLLDAVREVMEGHA